MPLWLVDFLSAEGIYKGSFSKYGAAVERQMALERVPRIEWRRRRRPETVRVLDGVRAGQWVAGMPVGMAACV